MSEEKQVSDLHQTALRAGVFQVIEREAKAAKDAAREALTVLLPYGDTVAGRVGDDLLCKAGWSKGSTKAVITDQAAFLAWVKEHHPTEVEVVESVNDAYVKSLKTVDGVVIDKDGLPVDGMEVVTGKPSLSVRSEKNALDLVQQLIDEGRVTLDAIKELPAKPLACPHCDEEPCLCADIVASEADVIDAEVVEDEQDEVRRIAEHERFLASSGADHLFEGHGE